MSPSARRKKRNVSAAKAKTYVYTCSTCGKHGYDSRKVARAAARRLFPGEPLSTYQCEHGMWHFGHLGQAVRNGTIPRVVVEVRAQRRLGIRQEGPRDAE